MISHFKIYSIIVCTLLYTLPLQGAGIQTPSECGLVSLAEISTCVTYPGPQTEKRLKDLLKADYHYGKALYYKNQQKTGFMSLERFELAYERAIGDIREAAYITDETLRKKRITHIFQSWQNAFFKRAQNTDPSSNI